jgi:two-component system OmpR family sensor kinase
MTPSPPRLRWSPPIAVQIVALLLSGIVVAQVVTLVLTLLMPPAPPPQHSLADIAAGLRGSAIITQGAKPLLRAADDQPPSLQSPGWFVPETAHADLARMMNADPDDVRLLFYAPLPFAGPPTRQLTTSADRPRPPSFKIGALDALRSAVSSRASAQAPPMAATAPPPGFPARMGGMTESSSSSSSSSGPDIQRGGAIIGPSGGVRQGGMTPGGMVIIRPTGGGAGRPPVWTSRFPSAGQVQGGQRPASITASNGGTPCPGRRSPCPCLA